jgi:hypothetical protein
MQTLREFMNAPRPLKKSGTQSDTLESATLESAVRRRQTATDRESAFLQRGFHLVKKASDVSDDLATEWVKQHPESALWGVQKIKEAVAAHIVQTASEIRKDKLDAQVAIEEFARNAEFAKAADRQAAHERLPEVKAAQAKLTIEYAKRDADLEDNPRGIGLTQAERDSRMARAERIAKLETRVRAPRTDRQFTAF